MSRMIRKLLSAFFLTVATAAHADIPANAPDRHLGVATCAASQCHGSAVAGSGSNVRQDEYVTWTGHDPHAGAYRTLLSEESLAIARRLGLAGASSADACLDCHADNVPVERRGERFQISDGVGCEACHGGAERWIDSHHNVAANSHADNLAAGLYPTASASDRATLCLSCHLGNDGKQATHRIMAAGHPRLAFELDTFTELWRTAGGREHFRVDDDYRARKGTLEHVDAWSVGLVTDALQRLELLATDLSRQERLFPELGLYDCHACHRSMKSVQWRRLPRHGNAPPGTPFVTDGGFVMGMVLARAISPELAGNIREALAALHSATRASGQQQALARLRGDFTALRRVLGGDSLANQQAAIRDAILQAGAAGEFLDYASAEQAFMAVQMLAYELGDAVLQQALDALAESLEDDERYRPAQFARLLQSVSQE